ncbi:17808_t:CDS:2 [Racocetra persica]|uniref:17808_t:CDS:1 n=1 Tax=Racocetra persica TaxID=160502 RepID=A0ACA9K9D5_9GLOM|nr:17808_t:CDS:2 [Racocetra persica]
MSKVNSRSRSSSPIEHESSRISISHQKIDYNNELHKIEILVNNLIREFGDVRTTKRLDLLWNPSVNTRAKTIPCSQNCFILFRKDITAKYNPQKNSSNSKKRVGKTISDSSKIMKERWAAIKKFNQHEYKFWKKLTEIANLKHKLRYLNYKYILIRKKYKKYRSNNTNHQVDNDTIKSIEIGFNKPLSDNNNCQNNSAFSLPLSDGYLTPSFAPYYLSHRYRQNIMLQYIVQNHNLIRTILSCTLPLSIVNNGEFRKFCSSLDSRFKLPNKIFEKLQFQLSKFKIARENIVSITIENEDSNNAKTALSQLQIKYIPCMANILRNSIDSKLFYTNNIINKSKKLIEILNNDTNRQKLREVQPPFNLVDIENDWNSVYQAINNLIILQPSILYLSREDEKLKENILSEDEFNIYKELDIILTLFYKLTEMLKHSKYSVLSFITPAIENIKQRLSIYQPKNNIVQQVKVTILDNLKKIFNTPSIFGLYESTTLNPVTINKDSKMLAFFYIFIQENRQTEFDKYLELPQLDVTEENNPLI